MGIFPQLTIRFPDYLFLSLITSLTEGSTSYNGNTPKGVRTYLWHTNGARYSVHSLFAAPQFPLADPVSTEHTALTAGSTSLYLHALFAPGPWGTHRLCVWYEWVLVLICLCVGSKSPSRTREGDYPSSMSRRSPGSPCLGPLVVYSWWPPNSILARENCSPFPNQDQQN